MGNISYLAYGHGFKFAFSMLTRGYQPKIPPIPLIPYPSSHPWKIPPTAQLFQAQLGPDNQPLRSFLEQYSASGRRGPGRGGAFFFCWFHVR